MGVKDLWNIISPSSDRRPLFELQGKAIAIDLSGWVVDSQSVTDNVAQPKMYLRNLFFRTSFLLMHEISPVFVLEGTAPTLKHKTIARRNEIRNGPPEKKTNKKGGRNHFNRILKECEEMLGYMGISCVRGHGEAEAMCAYLNAEKLVDGCISQDSDCFLYGAKIVYRNFCTSSQGNRGTSGGSIDEYTIEKIQRIFGLGRNKMIALALLCGCDYNEGINGVGKEAALKLFKLVDEDEILERMKNWRTDSRFEKMEAELSNPNICTTCGHQGKMRAHVKSGCQDCGTLTKCNDSYKEKRALMANEISIRKKALLVDDFPSQELINEFLCRKDPLPSSLDLKWKQPQILKFVNFMERHVTWEIEYAYAKILPLLTRWQIHYFAEIPHDRRLAMPGLLIPEKIKKPRNIRSVASYEIVWKDEEGLFEGMTLACISDKENDFEDSPILPRELATLEPQHLFQKCYPLLVEEFENAKLAKKKKPAKPRARKAKTGDEESDKKKGEKKKAQRRPRIQKSNEVKNRKIDAFIKTTAPTFEESFEALTITPKRMKQNDDITVNKSNHLIASGVKKRGPQFDKVKEVERLDNILNGSLLRMFNELTPEDFPSDLDDNDVDMSAIIDRICNKQDAANFSLESIKNFPSENILVSNTSMNCEDNLENVLGPKTSYKNRENSFLKFINSNLDDISLNNSKSKNEPDHMDCTLQRLLNDQKNAIRNKKTISCIQRPPNIFAIPKTQNEGVKKFDLLNFTYERRRDSQKDVLEDNSEKNIQKSFNNLDTFTFRKMVQSSSIDRLENINSSFERVRDVQKLLMDYRNTENNISQLNSSFNISELKLADQNETERQLDLLNSTFELLLNLNTENNFEVKNIEDNPRTKNDGSNSVGKNSENVQKPIKFVLDSARLTIPDENEFTDESDLFDFSNEYSRVQSPVIDSKVVENNKRKSTNVTLDQIKVSVPEKNESVDEFDLLNSTYVPLNQRIKELQNPPIVRSSTPDYMALPGKKFSFGIDDLLNDTDL